MLAFLKKWNLIYCCDSMIAPFEKNGYEVKLYAVEPYSNSIHRQIFTDHGCNAILLLDYFGFESEETEVFAMAERLRGTAVILDRVQSAFSAAKACTYADYTITSWRKWFFSCAATAEKKCGEWLVTKPNRVNEEYIALRREAANLKAKYIGTGVGEKQRYLEKFSDSEGILENDFVEYAAEAQSLEELRHIDAAENKPRAQRNTMEHASDRLMTYTDRGSQGISMPCYSHSIGRP